jgi:hypothetical protein
MLINLQRFPVMPSCSTCETTPEVKSIWKISSPGGKEEKPHPSENLRRDIL